MTMINVQFSDGTLTTIIAVFSCPQDPSEFPNQETISISDTRYVAYKSELPFNMQGMLP